MKDRFSREEMETLANYSNGICVSLYMPTIRAGRETEQNHIHLKNLLPQAEQQLIEAGMRPKEAQDILAPGMDLTSDYEFWQYQSEGLALFFAEDAFYRYRLPLQFEALTIVGPHFHLKPLMPVFNGDGAFYILALAQGQNRLFQATRHNIEELEAEQIPKSLADALWYYEQQQALQQHTTSAPNIPSSDKAGIHHGHGLGESRQQKDFIVEYFRQIDSALTELIRKEQAPLMLAGVEYLLPLYREANTYNNLLEEGITGSPKMLSADELHQRAWKIIEPYFDQPRRDAFDRFNELTGTGMASTEIDDIIPAAYYGRVDTLFVTEDQHRWGRFDPDDSELVFFEESHADNEDLLDRAAVQTFLNSGAVYVVDTSQIPGSGEIAAIYRY